jgi:hypothetical protein
MGLSGGVVWLSTSRTCPPRIKQVKRQSTSSLEAGASWRRSGVKLRVSAWPPNFSKTPDAALDWLCWLSGSHVCRPNVTCQTCLHGRGRIGMPVSRHFHMSWQAPETALRCTSSDGALLLSIDVMSCTWRTVITYTCRGCFRLKSVEMGTGRCMV